MWEMRYTPRNIQETLLERTDISELSIDLAYSALLAGDQELATEIIELESRVDVLEYHARIALMVAAKRELQSELEEWVIDAVPRVEIPTAFVDGCMWLVRWKQSVMPPSTSLMWSPETCHSIPSSDR